MYCPKCGKADQIAETYCRQCGIYLPDLDKPGKAPQSPFEHVRVNAILSGMTIVACFTLAILLYAMLAFRPDTHPLIYVTAALLLAMAAWQIHTLWRTMLLTSYLKKLKRPETTETGPQTVATAPLLQPADTEHTVPTSVVERTTRELIRKN